MVKLAMLLDASTALRLTATGTSSLVATATALVSGASVSPRVMVVEVDSVSAPSCAGAVTVIGADRQAGTCWYGNRNAGNRLGVVDIRRRGRDGQRVVDAGDKLDRVDQIVVVAAIRGAELDTADRRAVFTGQRDSRVDDIGKPGDGAAADGVAGAVEEVVGRPFARVQPGEADGSACYRSVEVHHDAFGLAARLAQFVVGTGSIPHYAKANGAAVDGNYP